MKYEIMYIVRPDLEESALKRIESDFEKILTSNKAKVVSKKDMGKRELAYEIKKYKSGYYFLINIEAHNSDAIKEFDRLALLSEDIIRHLIIKEN